MTLNAQALQGHLNADLPSPSTISQAAGDSLTSDCRRASSDCNDTSSGSCNSTASMNVAVGLDRIGCGDVSHMAAALTTADTMDCGLQLGNIAQDADQEALEQLLGWFGPLESVHVVPEMNLAFATYLAPQHAAAAKASLDGQALPCVTGDLPFLVHYQQRKASPPPQPQALAWELPQIDACETVKGACESVAEALGTGDITSLLSSLRTLGMPVNSSGHDDGQDNYVKPGGGGLPGVRLDDNCSTTSVVAGSGAHIPVCENQPSRHLFLAYVVQNIDQHVLALTFAPYGVVETVRVFPSMHYAFVNYLDVKSAIAAKAALEGKVIPAISGSRPLQMRYKHRTNMAAPLPRQAQNTPHQQPNYQHALPAWGTAGGGPVGSEAMPRGSAGGCGNTRRDDFDGMAPVSMAEGKPGRRLWVGNVPSDVGQDDAVKLFGPFGPLESVRVFPDRNFAFVNFVWPQHAATARSALNDKMVPIWKSNRTLLVRYPRDREPRIGREEQELGRGATSSTLPSVRLLASGDAGKLQDAARPRNAVDVQEFHHSNELGGRNVPMKMGDMTTTWAQSIISMRGLSTVPSDSLAQRAFGVSGSTGGYQLPSGGSHGQVSTLGIAQPPMYTAAGSGVHGSQAQAAGHLQHQLAGSSIGRTELAASAGPHVQEPRLQHLLQQLAQMQHTPAVGQQQPTALHGEFRQPPASQHAADSSFTGASAAPDISASSLHHLRAQALAAAPTGMSSTAVACAARPSAVAPMADDVYGAIQPAGITSLCQALAGLVVNPMGLGGHETAAVRTVPPAHNLDSSSGVGAQADLAMLLMQLMRA